MRDGGWGGEVRTDEGVELDEFRLRMRLVERLHRRMVRDLREALGHAAGDVADGRGRVPEFGVLVFEPQQLGLPQVIVAVADRRLVEVVVVVVRLLDEAAQLVDPRPDFGLRHSLALL